MLLSLRSVPRALILLEVAPVGVGGSVRGRGAGVRLRQRGLLEPMLVLDRSALVERGRERLTQPRLVRVAVHVWRAHQPGTLIRRNALMRKTKS